MARGTSSSKSFAAMINFAACTFNVGIAWWLYNIGSAYYVFNVVFAVFSGVLAFGNFMGYLEAKDAEESEKLYRKIYGR